MPKYSGKSLQELRAQIDRIDAAQVELVREREAVIYAVAELKKNNGVPIYDPGREDELIQAGRAHAEKIGADPDTVEGIIRLHLENSHRIQREALD